MSDLHTETHNNVEDQSNSGSTRSAHIVTKGTRLSASVRKNLLHEDTPEFEKRYLTKLEEIYAKYAWVAQQQGFVLRRNPLKQAPLKDYIFDRIAKAEYGFHYINKDGRTKLWRPSAQQLFGTHFIPL